ncbi:MAG TPA: DUF1570 domain-containing protein [Steroidobacteraceae bacterium]|nr:DUF1570 domain-containing protein [Steroidobacteraceae bacterium]
MTHRILIAILLAAIGLGIGAFAWHAEDAARAEKLRKRTALLIPANAAVHETDHYRVHYTSMAQQAALVGSAVEKLYAAYVSVFPQPASAPSSKLILVLYKDRAEFKSNNRSSQWAEAYYLPPGCYAYFDSAAENPYHWMLHEATHQLSRQMSGFRRNRWIDEGLASYFSTSKLDADGLQLGMLDPKAYPVWWLGHFRLSGDPARDFAAGKFLPIEVLLTGRGGPSVEMKFNLYYVDAWSLTHFMFHYEHGKYAQAYKQFLAKGASLEDFVALIGPLEKIQAEWYPYLQAQSLSQPEPFPLP